MSNRKKHESKGTLELVNLFQDLTYPDRDNAFHAIVYRFRQDVLNYCEIRCRKFGQSPEVAEEVVIGVFQSFAKKPGFDITRAKGKNDDHSFLIYLLGIARTVLTDIYRVQKRKKEGKWSDGSETIVTCLPSLPQCASLKNKVVHQVLSELPYSHQVIFMTYKSYENAGCNLPRKLLNELREHLGIEQVTIRSYKKETLDKIEIALKGIRILEAVENES